MFLFQVVYLLYLLTLCAIQYTTSCGMLQTYVQAMYTTISNVLFYIKTLINMYPGFRVLLKYMTHIFTLTTVNQFPCRTTINQLDICDNRSFI